MNANNNSQEQSDKFREYQGYQDLCRTSAFFLEFPVKNPPKEMGISLRDWLISNPSSKMSCLETLNLIYQLLTVYDEIKTKRMMNSTRYFLNLNKWFLKGKILRTDNFHPNNSIIREKTTPIEETNFKYAKANKIEDFEKILIFDIGVLFHRLLKGEFITEKAQCKKAIYDTKREKLNESLISLIYRMMEMNFELRECRDQMLKIYKTNFFKCFIDVKGIPLYATFKGYTMIIHSFLNSLDTKGIYFEINTKINLILGKLIVFLRTIISMPINYDHFTQEMYIFVEESDQESRKYEEFFENYCDLVSLFIEDQQKKVNSVPFLPELLQILQDFNIQSPFSLKNLETFATSSKIYSKDFNEQKTLKTYLEFWAPFNKYEENMENFNLRLQDTIKKYPLNKTF